MRERILGFIAGVFFKLLSATWRVQVREPESLKACLRERHPTLFAHWHGDELVLLILIGPYRIVSMASSSKDGQIMDTVVKMVGGMTTRGSSTRGAVRGLLGLVKAVRKTNRNVSFAVDGPKGPLHEVKPGVFEMSRLLHSAPIFPCGVAYDRAWKFEKSWNKTFLPKPFARVVIHWGEPLRVSPQIDPRNEDLKRELKRSLQRANLEASKNFAAL
ncbi:MAG: hypothetical protein C5B49_05550 [Bdellovibrio sp.]|nr:MAG: hypothetical protein C5B49_05550 [Bdellovibrio sp.]